MSMRQQHCSWIVVVAALFACHSEQPTARAVEASAPQTPSAPEASAAAKSAFAHEFSGAELTSVERTESNSPLFVPSEPDLFLLGFRRDGANGDATYTSSGVLVRTTSDAKLDSLPDAVRTASTKAWIGAHIKSVSREEIRAAETFTKLEHPSSVYLASAPIEHDDVVLLVRADGKLLDKQSTPRESDQPTDSDTSDSDSSGDVVEPADPQNADPASPPLDEALMKRLRELLESIAAGAKLTDATPLFETGTAPPTAPVGYALDFSIGDDVLGTLDVTSADLPVQLEIDSSLGDLPDEVKAVLKSEYKDVAPESITRRDDLAKLEYRPLREPRVLFHLLFEDGSAQKWITYDKDGRLLASEDVDDDK